MNTILNFQPISNIFYCFGIIIPTLALLFSYGNFAYRIGEYEIESKKLDHSMPIILVLILTKLFLISFVMFFIYHYTFDNYVEQNNVLMIKCFLWGLLITVDTFLLNKELIIVCKHYRTIQKFKEYLYFECNKLYQKFKVLFYIKILLVLFLIVMFIISLFTNNLSFITLLLILYIYYNIRTNLYVKKIEKDILNKD